MTCDYSCIPKDERGRPIAPRRFPIERVCCALAILRLWDEAAHPAFFRILEIQVGSAYALEVRDEWARIKRSGSSPRETSPGCEHG